MNKEIEKNTNSIKDLVEKSGNSFHYEVVKFLRDNGWTVLVSPYYNDNFTEKPREIDIIIEKEFDVRAHFGDFLGTINVKLFIECKYVNSETVFWFDSINKDEIIKRIMKDTGLESPQKNTAIEKHRFMQIELVAKLFASKPDKLQENEIIYKALNQSLNSMVYFKNSVSIIPKNTHKVTKILKTLNYPVIICNNFNKLHKIDASNIDGIRDIENNFQLEINYAYLDKNKESKNEYFIVDIVDFLSLDCFLRDIEEKDVRTIGDQLSWIRK